MRVSVQYSDVSHVRLERVTNTYDGAWHKLYVTDCKGNTDEICLFGHHNWPRQGVDGVTYDDIAWRGFDAVLRDRGTPDNPVHGVPFDDVRLPDSVED